jgi:hypothetical protein
MKSGDLAKLAKLAICLNMRVSKLNKNWEIISTDFQNGDDFQNV